MQQRDIQLNFVPKPPSLPLPSKTTFSPMSSTPICSRPFAPGFPSSSIRALKLLMCGATSSSRAGTSEAVGGGCLNCRSLVRVWKVELSGRVEDDACEGASGSKAATMAGGGGGKGIVTVSSNSTKRRNTAAVDIFVNLIILRWRQIRQPDHLIPPLLHSTPNSLHQLAPTVKTTNTDYVLKPRGNRGTGYDSMRRCKQLRRCQPNIHIYILYTTTIVYSNS